MKELDTFVVRKPRYDWRKLANGKAYSATRGKDFDCTSKGFANSLYVYARSVEGLSVSVQIRGDEVRFKFRRQRRAAKV